MSDNKNSQKSKACEKEQLLIEPGQIPSEAIKDNLSMEDSEMKTPIENNDLTKFDSSPEDESRAEEKKLIRFTCPKCGGHRLVEGQEPFSCICDVEGGNPEAGKLVYVKDSDGRIDLEYRGDGGEFWYYFRDCFYDLEGMENPEEMCEWLEANCEQED